MVCILLVEDDVQFNKIVCSYLSESGYNVVGCHSAAEALEQMEKISFDMIISDIMMKDVNGFEFAEQVNVINTKDCIHQGDSIRLTAITYTLKCDYIPILRIG